MIRRARMSMQELEEAEWVGVAEAMAILGLSRRSVYRLMEEGTIWYQADTTRRRLRRSDVERWAGMRGGRGDGASWMKRTPEMRPYRRDGAPMVTDEEFEQCRPYGYMGFAAEEEKIREWREEFGRG